MRRSSAIASTRRPPCTLLAAALAAELASSVAGGGRPMAVAWYDATSELVESYPVEAIPWSNLTHIVYNGGFQPYANGSLAYGQDMNCGPSGCTYDWNCGAGPADCLGTLHALRDAAHSHGVKVLIGGLDLFEGNTSLAYAWLNSTCPSSSSPSSSGGFGTATATALTALPCIEVYAKSIASFVTQHGIDGAEFDFEDFGDCDMAEMHCPPSWANNAAMDRYALSQFAKLHRLTRAAMGPTKIMGIDLSTGGPLLTSNDSTTVGCFDYFTTMLYSVGEAGFEADKASITAFMEDKGLPRAKVLFGNGSYRKRKRPVSAAVKVQQVEFKRAICQDNSLSSGRLTIVPNLCDAVCACGIIRAAALAQGRRPDQVSATQAHRQ